MSMKQLKTITKDKCCGCSACANICGHAAITMVSDDLGFSYPTVNETLCVECGLCEKVCQFNHGYLRYDNFEQPDVFSVRLKNEEQLVRSQSGGAFYAIADYIIKSGGVVYGAAFDKTWRVAHQRAADLEQLEALRMSKYVQSDLDGVYALVKSDLSKGLKVLFSGTACQVAGLKAYLPDGYHANIYCIDIICHGVPSPKIWQDYIRYVETKYGSHIVKACFRDKRFGWHGAQGSFRLEDNREIFMRTNNYLYSKGYNLRECCASCVFTNTKRVGDITIGDHWGLPKDSPYEKDAKGVSLVLVNSGKGSLLFNEIKILLNTTRVRLNECLQPRLQRPHRLNPRRDKFVSDYLEKGFEYVAFRYGDLGWRYRFRKILTRIISKLKS